MGCTGINLLGLCSRVGLYCNVVGDDVECRINDGCVGKGLLKCIFGMGLMLTFL